MARSKLSRAKPGRGSEPPEVAEDGAPSLLPSGLAQAIGYHLRLAQEASFSAFKARVGSADLKPGRFAILSLIAANPGITATALSRACGRDKSTLTPALRDLMQRGVVLRERSAADERSFLITLTPAGRALLRRLRTHAEAHDRALDEIVGPDMRAAFIATLQRIAQALSEEGSLAPRQKQRAANTKRNLGETDVHGLERLSRRSR